MDTKLTGDIAVQYAVLEGLKRGWGVMLPVGDRLPYDLVYDVGGYLFRIQAKSAWKDSKRPIYVVDTRRHKTNRVRYKAERYQPSDFDVAMLWHPEAEEFYLMPIAVFLSYKSSISLPARDKRTKHPCRADPYLSRWDLISSS